MPTPHQFFSQLAQHLSKSAQGKRSGQRGFVLPVAILIVLVLSLVTVGLLTRSTQRNFQTQVERAGQVVTGQVNTAIDRARAKIDFLINDPRLPRSTPSDTQLAAALINDDIPDTDPAFILPALRVPPPPAPNGQDPYILPDETRFTIDSEFDVPNPDFVDPITTPAEPEFLPVPVRSAAWWFNVDTDGDGNDDSVTVYTILTNRRSPNTNPALFGPDPQVGYENRELTDEERANRLLVRGGPLQGAALEGCVDVATNVTGGPDTGDWFQVGSKLFKPFQVYAVTIPTDGASATTRALSALQFQQDRQRSVLNKWGAFSRGDVEFFFTPNYNWNGAIYAGGSLFYRYGNSRGFRAYLISSEGSCFYLPVENSEIKTFGELVSGAIGYPGPASSTFVDFDSNPGERNTQPRRLPPNPLTRLDGSGRSSITGANQPEDVALDPLDLLLFNRARNRGNNPITRNPDWGQSPINSRNSRAPDVNGEFDGRIEAGQFDVNDPRQLCPPYVDDTFRADNRFGPKPSYERPPQSPESRDVDNDGEPDGCNVKTFSQVYGGATAGQIIPATASNSDNESLTENEPPRGSLESVGLDGYWERRARREGLRVVVGQRLELARSESNPIPLLGQPSDPNPATPFNEAIEDPRRIQLTLMTNEQRQRVALRDNPAAVQAAAVYHYSRNNGQYPVACLAMTAHPGSAESLRRASSFPNTPTDGINFFTGEGTNVWEFEPPNENNFRNPGSDLMVALRNLAFFAGDDRGAYPPQQVNGEIHPDPFLSAFGNFSELRRLFNDGGLIIGYDNLSLADRTTLHTAGCALGMLAWNIEQINGSADPTLQAISTSIADSRDGDAANPLQTADVREGRVIGFEGLLDNPASQRLYLPLWYVFPTTAHQDRNPADAGLGADEGANLIRRRFSTAVNTTYRYSPVNLANVRFTPRATIGAWSLPHAPQACANGTAGPNSSTFELIQIGNQCHRVPFKDTVVYDGREAMALRVMNVDLALLTANVPNQQNPLINGDTWLPDGSLTGGGIEISEGGIFYAFREDAVREDAVARPALTDFATYRNTWRANRANGVVGDALIMNAGQPGRVALVGDPPLEPTNRLSPKPVDYFADPDRRPYGFRLKNGAVLQRGATSPAGVNIDPDATVFGLSFITDNSLYVQGDFNLHQDRFGNRLEEFNQLVGFAADDSYSNFYGRPRSDENRDFARAKDDLWRPTDVVADSVNILSDNFCDGSIDDGFLQDGTLNRGGNTYNPDRAITDGRTSSPRRVVDYGCTDAGIRGAEALGNTSFINQALVYRGQNWPANDPNNGGAGVRRFDNTQESQELGNVTTQPGHPDLFARDTAIRSFPAGSDLTVGRNIPAVRDIRPPDRSPTAADPSGYIGYPTRISNLGNPVLDTSRWVQTSLACPNPGGNGLTAEYYNGWLNNAVSANATTGDPAYDRTNSATNRPFLKAVRIPDPAFSSLTQFLYQWGQRVGGNNAANDSGQPFRITQVPTFGSAGCVFDNSDPNFLKSCWTRIVEAPPNTTPDSNNDNGRRYFGTRWIGQLFPLFPGRVTYRVDGAGAVRLRIFANPAYAGPPIATALSPNPASGIREQWNGDDNNLNAEVTGTFECSPSRTESPYLVEIQQLRQNANTNTVRLVARPDGVATTPAGGYPLSYLRPIPTDNIPCQPDTSAPLLANQEYCQTTCQVTFGPVIAPLCPAVICGSFTLAGERTRTETCPDGTVTTTTIAVPNATVCNQQSAENCTLFGPDCVFPADAGQTITQTRTCNPTSTCPTAIPNPPLSQEITCSNTCNDVFTDFTPPCDPLVNGGQTINQTRTGIRNCQDGTSTEIMDPALLTQTTTCPQTCNYDNPPFTPTCASDARSSVCGNGFTITQSRTRNLIAATSSPTCAATQFQTNNLNCPQQACGPNLFVPEEMRPDSPLNRRDLQARGVQPYQSDQSVSLGRVAQSVVNWFLGEPAHAAEQGIPSTLLGNVSNPQRPPGIRPAEAPGQLNDLRATLTTLGIGYTDDLNGLTPAQQEEFARSARRVFMQCPNDDFSTDLVDALGRIDDGAAGNGVFFVPGVFQPNFNTTFGYTAYNGGSIPSTLRYSFTYGAADVPAVLDPNCPDPDANNLLTSLERQAGNCRFLGFDGGGNPLDTITNVFDRDPLFGFDANADGDLVDAGDFQPQMYLNPYGRVTNNNTQNYTSTATYRDGYYIDEADVGRLSNGLCFYVRVNSGQAQIRIDRNGNSGGGLAWVTVESISRDNRNRDTTNPSTGYAGTNPLLAVVLDERTRRPIPLPRWDELNPGNDQRKRLDRVTQGTPVVNRQLIPAEETRVNMIAVSGTVPSRLDQPNGGIPNFLRLSELWDDINLFFGGSLIELNYSTSATAPLYQQSFEPPNRQAFPAAQQLRGFDYYFPPNRRFGYDVGLQIARSISPVSARFEFPDSAVSEFLRDVPPQDPYVRRLRCALQEFIDDNPGALNLDRSAQLDPALDCAAFPTP